MVTSSKKTKTAHDAIQKRQLKIISDGTTNGTFVIDTKTNKPTNLLVKSIKININSKCTFTTAVIEILAPQVDIVTEFEIKKYNK